MSMLAEPRRKIKWTLNPRGNLWAEDESSYGQRMLRKMGWKKGKGLGKNEDGNTEHIKVTCKNDKKGIGSIGCEDDWIAHQDDFNSVLSSLNEKFNSSAQCVKSYESKPKSLEKKSKSSRSRVHYSKFIRGKDITRYSSEDMAAIFGNRKKENQESISKDEELAQEDHKECSSSTSITYSSGKSVQEYFIEKMAMLRGKGKKVKKDCQSDTVVIPSEGKSQVGHSINFDATNEDQQSSIKRKQRKKDKKHRKRKNLQIRELSECENDQLSTSSEKDILRTESNVSENEANYSPPLITKKHRKNNFNTDDQDKLCSAESENAGGQNTNLVLENNTVSVDNPVTGNDKLLKLSVVKRKRKSDEILNESESQECKSSELTTLDNLCEAKKVARTDKAASDGKRTINNCLTSLNQSRENNEPTKCLNNDKEKEIITTKSVENDLLISNAKTIRRNALQQMEIYFDFFPNRHANKVLLRYEEMYEKCNATALATSNFLSVPGYVNKLMSMDKST